VTNREFGPVIACRRYLSACETTQAAVVEVEIAAPVESSDAPDEFMGSFRVKTPTTNRVATVHGIDGLQSLLLALAYLETILREFEASLGHKLC
jgi:Domain of unknown function (DUF6968)